MQAPGQWLLNSQGEVLEGLGWADTGYKICSPATLHPPLCSLCVCAGSGVSA